MRTMLLSVILVSALLGYAQAQHSSAKGSPDAEAEIGTIIAEGADAWNRHDAEAIVAHMSEAHDHINVDGAWRSGKAETEKAVRAFLATTHVNSSRIIERIRFLTTDVAIAVVRYEYSDGQKRWQSISTSVFHKANGRWWNEAFQNTLIQPPRSPATK
jgi:uncharacterized protein (TIGR02246 family)